jgi:predicted RNA-binding Zn ribbon-like protein
MPPAGRPAFDVGGRLALDLTWTLRYRAVRPTELLLSPEDLRRWLRTNVLASVGEPTDDDLHHTRQLREAIYRAASAVIDGATVAPQDRKLINRWAAEPPPAPQLRADGSRRLHPPGNGITAALSAMARDAIDLVTADDGRLRRCDGPRCSLLFYDSSRPGSRRWCATSRCGNKVNTHAYRARQRTTG